MSQPPGDRDPHSLQAVADFDSLLNSARANGEDVERYKAALADLSPVFDALSFGWRPIYQDLDVGALSRRMPEIIGIVRWMAASQKADLRTRAIELMGFLGWQSFGPDLRRHLSAEAASERAAAIAADG